MLLFFFAPRLWKAFEPFPLEPDYRMPHDIANDYWLYERHADQSAEHYDAVLIGDSVVWGEYVKRDETLSHYLNEITGEQRYANLGLDGANPLALEGLVEHYAGNVKGKTVLLECNLLWLSSPNIDLLQDENGKNVNSHPRLAPQFSPRIPSYNEDLSTRLGVVVEQHTPLAPWTNHLQQAYYNRSDIPAWTLAHPYDSPVAPLTQLACLASDHSAHQEPRSWEENGIALAGLSLDRSEHVAAMARLSARRGDSPTAWQPRVRAGRPLQRTHAETREPGTVSDCQGNHRGVAEGAADSVRGAGPFAQ